MERRTVGGEGADVVQAEMDELLAQLSRQDPDFHPTARVVAYRPAYALDASHTLPRALGAAIAGAGYPGEPTGMTFWTDAAILADAGIPSVLFGPGGAGLHSISEYVNVDDVYACRDILVDAIKALV